MTAGESNSLPPCSLAVLAAPFHAAPPPATNLVNAAPPTTTILQQVPAHFVFKSIIIILIAMVWRAACALAAASSYKEDTPHQLTTTVAPAASSSSCLAHYALLSRGLITGCARWHRSSPSHPPYPHPSSSQRLLRVTRNNFTSSCRHQSADERQRAAAAAAAANEYSLLHVGHRSRAGNRHGTDDLCAIDRGTHDEAR